MRVLEIIETSERLVQLNVAWTDSILAYKNHVSSLFEKFDMEVVVYDEVEKFRSYNDPQFSYPYQKRKNNLGYFNFEWEVPNSATLNNYDYSYKFDNL